MFIEHLNVVGTLLSTFHALAHLSLTTNQEVSKILFQTTLQKGSFRNS